MRACLVVHGLSGTPATVASVTEGLTEAGYRVIAPCLAGHGGTVEELSETTWPEWYETVRKAYLELRRDGATIYYAGISLGALLGLKLAIDEGANIRALSLLATPLQLLLLNKMLIPLVRYTPLRLAVKSVAKDYRKSVADPEGQRLYREHSLPRIPAKAAFQLWDLQKLVRSEIAKVHNPLLLLHSRNDMVAPYSNVHLIKELVSSPIVETATFTHSRHVLTLDVERELATNAILQFFKRFP